MRLRLSAVTTVATVLAVTGCAGSTVNPAAADRPVPEQATGSVAPTSPAPDEAQPAGAQAATTTLPFRMTTLGTYDEPWAMTFLGRTGVLAVTERPGRLTLRTPTGRRIVVSGTPRVVPEGQGGLGDVVAAPRYDGVGNKLVYLSWVERGSGGTSGAVVGHANLLISGTTAKLTDLRVIWRQSPKVTGSGHYSHRLAFSPDGRYLFVSSGERQKFTPAQNLKVNLGKILRLTPAGRPAPGNPFAARGGVAAQIWSYGHRNPLGLAFDASGRLWSSEMGPKGGDELNLIEPGRNYGWPKASNGSHYDGRDIPDHRPGDGFAAPRAWWNPSISPSGLMIYRGRRFPWRGDAFLPALSGEGLIRVHLVGRTATKANYWRLGHRIREVEQGLDGFIYLLEDGPGGRLLKLSPR